ncbi:LAGLIDADG family homing endonuclease [Luminiphilus sp.]|nr:LAGLIDADG family homing endonuclease [Luminiphilus sp.]
MNINNLEQQTVKDLAWLGGFWDADGHISVVKRDTYLVAVCSATNTNKTLIDNVMRILDSAEIGYRVDYQDRGERTNAKPAWIVKMESRVRCLPFLQMIRPYLVGKQEQADLVIQHCKLPKGNGPKAGERTDGYWEIRDQVQALNKRGRVRD